MQLLKVSTKILLVSNHNFKRIYLKVCVVYVFEIFLQTVNTFSTHFGLFDPTKFFKKLLRKPNLFTIQVFDKVKCFLCSSKQKPSRKKTKMKQEKKIKIHQKMQTHEVWILLLDFDFTKFLLFKFVGQSCNLLHLSPSSHSNLYHMTPKDHKSIFVDS